MKKIKELLKDKDSVLIFDIDGVLAVMEFGHHTHFMSDEEWEESLKENKSSYTEDKVSNKMKNFLKDKNKDNLYVITKIEGDNEISHKRDFAYKYYNIPKEHVYFVNKDSEKIDKLLKIKESYPNLEAEKIIMIDDTVEILNDVMEKTNCSTAHISSFLDID